MSPTAACTARPLASTPGAAGEENRRLRQELARLLSLKRKFGAPMSDEMTAFLRTVEDPATFVDLAAFGFCEDAGVKQKLLETLDTHRRLQLFSAQVRAEIEAVKLRRKLQGPLGDDDVSNN
jgi:ATP-dependent Lon protease